MPLNRVWSDPQSSCHGRCIKALSEQPQHLELAVCQLPENGDSPQLLGRNLSPESHVLDRSYRWRQDFATIGAPDCFQDLVRRGGCGEVGASSCVDRLEQRLLGWVRRVEDDCHLWACCLDHPGGART